MIPGIDVSRFNVLSSRTLDGQAFAFARATYGTSTDPSFYSHTTAFKAAGIVTGAYAFGIGMSGAQQANSFLAVAHSSELLALDLEGDPNPMSEAQAREFIATVQAKGYRCGLYHSRWGFPSLGQDWNWVAQWGGTPPTNKWAFWQWQGSPIDRDYWNGDLDSLHRFAGRSVPVVTSQKGYVKGSFWDYRISGSQSAGYTISRTAQTTDGFPVTLGSRLNLSWGGHPRRFVKIIGGHLVGHWLDLNNTPAVQLV